MSYDFEHGSDGGYDDSNEGFKEQLERLHEERMQQFISSKNKDASVGLLKYGLSAHVNEDFAQSFFHEHKKVHLKSL